nr:MAG TPA: hypothetical protein [Caudoviricetes sp.]
MKTLLVFVLIFDIFMLNFVVFSLPYKGLMMML